MSGSVDEKNLLDEMVDIIKRVAEKRTARSLRNRKISTEIDDKLAMAAFEAHRNIAEDNHFQDTVVRIGSYLVVFSTILAPFVIFFNWEKGNHGIIWDRFGLVSTMILLTITFGVDVIKNVLNEVMDGGMSILIKKIRSVEVVLFFICIFLCWRAWLNLNQIHNFEEIPNHDNSHILSLYLWHVIFIWTIGIAFMAMDIAVAHGSEIHRQSFAASSSFVHSTFPMFFGNTLVLIWCFLGYYWNDRADIQMMHFVTGALTFQMIASNLLFVAVNEDWVVRFCRTLTYSTKRP